MSDPDGGQAVDSARHLRGGLLVPGGRAVQVDPRSTLHAFNA